MDTAPDILQHWPTLDSSWGCEDCRVINATTDEGRCRTCGSRSTFPIFATLAEVQDVKSGRLLWVRSTLADTTDTTTPTLTREGQCPPDGAFLRRDSGEEQ